jgi:2-phosphosulfolactate phosphatase
VRIQAYFSAGAVDSSSVQGSTAVVIDVIRATSTLLEALVNGARGVYPTVSIEEAVQLAASLGREDTLLTGERKGLKVEGFDLGNSPREFRREVVDGRQVVMTTTNGTRAFMAVASAQRVLSAAFANLSAVAEAVADVDSLVVVCAGKEDRFSLDDAVCAGFLIRRLVEDREDAVEMNDAARAAVKLAQDVRVTPEFLADTAAGAALVEVGLREDLTFVAGMDRHDVVPEMIDRVIRIPPGSRA